MSMGHSHSKNTVALFAPKNLNCLVALWQKIQWREREEIRESEREEGEEVLC
jgi:hypothetical protein